MKITRLRAAVRATVASAAAFVIAAGIGIAGTAPAQADAAWLCSGYQGCANLGMSNHGYSTSNQNWYWRMYPGHNCTNYAAYMMVKAGMPNVRPWTNATGNAAGWGEGMDHITNTTPKIGSIAWWTGGAGHVAYVEAVLSSTEIMISEDAWGGDFQWRIIKKSSGGWPKGFIHFKDRSSSTVPAYRGKPAYTTVYKDASKTSLANTSIMNPGSTAWVEMAFQNTGRYTWKNLELATQEPGDHDSKLATNWLSPNRAAKQTQAEVRPGQTATFGFAITIPAGLADGTPVVEHFAPKTTDGKRVDFAASALRVTADSRSLFVNKPTPTVSGTLVEGSTVTANAGSWSPTPATLTYTWKRNGAVISGATGKTYVLTEGDVGRNLTVTTTAAAPRFVTETRVSANYLVKSKHSDTLVLGTALLPGEQRVSANGKFRIYQRADGNLVLQNRISRTILWSNNQKDKAVKSVLKTTGSLAAYSAANTTPWRTKTSNVGVVKLFVNSDGRVQLITSTGKTVWSAS